MEISKKEIKYLAQLCRLELTEKEEENLSKELSSVLDYVKQLNEVDTADVKPTSQITGLENVIRKDELKIKEKELREKLLDAAPQREGDYVKVKAVFSENL